MRKRNNLKDKFKKIRFNKKTIPYLLLLTITMLSVGYSAFSSHLNISGVVTTVRIKRDVRITGVSVESNDEEGESKYTEYNINKVKTGIELPNQNSSVTYNVEVTNIGNVDVGVLELTGLPDNLDYEFLNYNLKEKICESEGKCNLGIQKNIKLKIKYKEGYKLEEGANTHYDVVADFNFQPFYQVAYQNLDIPACRYVSGTEGKVGAKYICNLGDTPDTQNLNFYILEETNSDGKVTLIMDNNYPNSSTTWCSFNNLYESIETECTNGTYPENICIGASSMTCSSESPMKLKLNEIRNNWNRLDSNTINIPTADQIAKVESQIFEYQGMDIYSSWLFENLNNNEGYWTSTVNFSYDQQMAYAIIFDEDNYMAHLIDFGIDGGYGIRPTITINEDELAKVPDLSKEVMGNTTLTIDFQDLAPTKLKVNMDNKEITDYTYENGILTIPSVSGNIEIIKDVESRLPDEYQEVEYIASSGTQYIDTGYIPKTTTVINADFMSTKQIGDEFSSLFGSQIGSGVNKRTYILFGRDNNIQVALSSSEMGFAGLNADGSYTKGKTSTNPYWNVSRTNYILSILDRSITIEGVTWDLSDYFSETLDGDFPIFLLTRNTNGVADTNCSKGYLYGFTIYENNVLVRNMIPCYRKSDNVIGMYDLVNNVFYMNSGTGTFTKGNDVE